MAQIRYVAKLSAASTEILKGTTHSNGVFFNPIQDENGTWIITLQEAQFVDRNETYFSVIEWVKPVITKEL